MQSAVKHLVFFGALSAAVAGCNEAGIVNDDTSATPTAPPVTPTPTPDPTPTPVSSVTELYHQTYGDRKVDVLWVIDNSGSMSGEQDEIAASFQDFIQGFVNLDLDFQLGVITTDMEDTQWSGKLQGSPTFLTPQTPNLVTTMQARLDVGTGSFGNELGLNAAQAALSEPLRSGHNAGFLRDDAVLSVIFLSDEDNYGTSSPAIPWQNFATFFGTLKPDLTKLHVTAIVGNISGSCSGPFGNASEAPEYHHFVQALNGTISNICTDDFQVTLTDLSSILAALATTFPLEYQPIPGTISVTVGGVQVPPGTSTWNYNPVSNEIVFAEDAIPPECTDVDITYALAPGQQVTEPVFEHPDDPDCGP